MIDFKKLYKITESINIHYEIFKETSDYKHYLLGVAQGVFCIYETIYQYKDKVQDNEYWLKMIKNSVLQDEKIESYFNRLLHEKEIK